MKAGAKILTPYGFIETLVKVVNAIDGIHLYTDKSVKSDTWYHADKCTLIV